MDISKGRSSKRRPLRLDGFRRRCAALGAVLLCGALSPPTLAQQPAAPVVGVVQAERRPLTTTVDFVGRVEAIGKVDLRARVTGFLQKRAFEEGTEVSENQELFKIDPSQFQAEVDRRKAEVTSAEALVANARIQRGRAEGLRGTPAFTQARLDDAESAERQAAAQVEVAKANLDSAQINLGYTEIRAPLAGKIGRSTFTVGAVIGPDAGNLATIVSQDPMYVTFPISIREGFAIRERMGAAALEVAVKIKLPDGSDYPHKGKIVFVDNQVDRTTDTILIRASIANPIDHLGGRSTRKLIDGVFVSVTVENAEPAMVVTVPRSAILADQQGPYLFIVDKDGRAQVRRIRLGQGTPDLAAVENGLEAGDTVIVEGIQRVRPTQPVKAEPMAPAIRQPAQPK